MRANAENRLRKLLAPFRRTFLHPQWLIFRLEERKLATLGQWMSGVVVDIGCAQQRPRGIAPGDCHYIGLDYYQTATEWYGSRPDVFGDAQKLPFASGSAHCALLLDVLEHLPEPDRCIGEVRRVLRPEGRLIVQVPFLYPIHDAPLDFQRWTPHGLARLAERNGFRLERLEAVGSPAESAALLVNLAFTRAVMRWIEGGSPLALVGVFAPLVVVVSNLVGALFAVRSGEGDFMSLGFRCLLRKS
ncbi:MAG TPA: class I SAM-dependent methyltransferase [Gammaproteobacteria bacterium]|nr:class I SAM-dependent methyltransferase [Gammaproteobacteria bacterium]